MSCTNPLLAIDLGVDFSTNKHRVKILPVRLDMTLDYYKERYGSSLLRLPCGKCDSCRLTHRKVWAVRCMYESKMHLQNCFVTLTYDNEHYDPKKMNKKEDLQKFIHSLRDSGLSFRYFACGEYGSLNRFHYHIIMFGYFPSDAKPLGKKLDNMYYKSDYLTRYWKKGNVIVGECSPSSCEYVAGYTNKKDDLNKQAFLLMSNRPGIGYQYFVTHKDEANKYGVLLGENGSVNFISKYGNKLYENIGCDLSSFKDKRVIEMSILEASDIRKFGIKTADELLIIKSDYMKDKISKKRRINL